MSDPYLDVFARDYMLAALFTTDPDPGQGEYAEHDDWTIDNIAPEAYDAMVKDCLSFMDACWDDIHLDLAHAGRDFWYTRNGHGCGFWDGDWPEAIGGRLTYACKAYGEQDLYLGDDGRLYVS